MRAQQMWWKQAAAAAVVTVAGGALALGLWAQQGKPAGKSPQKAAARAAAAKPAMTVYKTASCGCCRSWVDHVKQHGYQVAAHDTSDVASIKQMLGVPQRLSSCHTAVVGGYVIEGHVPADVIDKLLRERPKVVGIAVPGMPTGSPGMEAPGRAPDRYDVLTFDKQGKTAVYAKK